MLSLKRSNSLTSATPDNVFQMGRVFAPLLMEKHRYKVYWGGRGAAKSWAMAAAIVVKGSKVPLRVLCTRELQVSIKDSVHKLLEDTINRLGLKDHYEVLGNEIRGKNGTLIIFKGIKHSISEIKSTEGIDICWVEEAENVTKRSWSTLIPTIRKDGSEIWVSFNPRKKTDATYQRFVVNRPTDSYVRKVSWRDNKWFPDVLKQEMEDDKRDDFDMYLHVWEGEFLTYAENAVYAPQLRKMREENRIITMPVSNEAPVNTFWDLGKDDHTAIWFHQFVGREHRFIDYHHDRFKEVEDYAEVVNKRGYTYGRHYFPHDVAQDRLGMTQTVEDQFVALGVKPLVVVPRISSLEQGILMTRRAMAGVYIDPVRCAEGIECLSNYERKYDDENDTHSERPIHNWASNGCLVAGSMVATTRGDVAIEDVVIGDKVLTPWGERDVLNSGVTMLTDDLVAVGPLVMTPDHKVYTNKGFVRSDALRKGDTISFLQERYRWLSTKGENTGFRKAITEAGAACYIGSDGRPKLALSLAAITSTIKTAIQRTTSYQTLSAYLRPIIQSCTPLLMSGWAVRPISSSLERRASAQKNGTHPQRVGRGTVSTASNHGRVDNQPSSNANAVASHTRHTIPAEANGALQAAKPARQPLTGRSITKLASALCAAISSALTSTRKHKLAASPVPFSTGGKSVPVYDLTIDIDQCYYANGVLVSNSDAFRQFAQGYQGSQNDWIKSTPRLARDPNAIERFEDWGAGNRAWAE